MANIQCIKCKEHPNLDVEVNMRIIALTIPDEIELTFATECPICKHKGTAILRYTRTDGKWKGDDEEWI